MPRGDRHAAFEWRAGVEKEKKLALLDQVVNFQEVMESSQNPITLERLDSIKSELLKLHQAIGNNWYEELIFPHPVEKKGLFGKKEEIVQEIDENKRLRYRSYFYSVIEGLIAYKKQLEAQEPNCESIKILNRLNVKVKLSKFPNYFDKGSVNIEKIMKTFPQLVHGITDFVAAEKTRLNGGAAVPTLKEAA